MTPGEIFTVEGWSNLYFTTDTFCIPRRSRNPAEPIVLDPYAGEHPLLLNRSPDFYHVAPLRPRLPLRRACCSRYADELVRRSLTEFRHPADCVPLGDRTRE